MRRSYCGHLRVVAWAAVLGLSWVSMAAENEADSAILPPAAVSAP